MWKHLQPDLKTQIETHHGRKITCFVKRPHSLHQMFNETAKLHGARPALIGDEGATTYAELLTKSNQIAGGLKALGLQKGDRVALLMGNRFAFVETLLACFTAGLICVPLNPLQRAPEMAFTLNQCSAKAVIYDAAFTVNLPKSEDIPSVTAFISAYGSGGIPYTSLLGAPSTPRDCGETDTSVLLYTSGTTGRPKGAMLTHLSIIHSSLQFAAACALDPNSRMLLAAPASHVTGLIACILAPLCTGGAIVMMGAFKAKDALTQIETHAITHTMGPPAIYALMLLEPGFDTTDISSWRLGGYGGAPMPEATIAELGQRAPKLGLTNGYGSTEANGPFTTLPTDCATSHSASVGLVVHCCDISIRTDNGIALPAGQSGEIWMKGPNVVPGYWDNPQANADNFEDGWWKSGDIGHIDAEGFVYVLDRKKDMLNRGGYKIYSAEVENQLSFHPNITECAIIAKPCPVMGERVRAVVVTSAEPTRTLAEDIQNFAATRLSKYKVPEDILFRSTPLPRNPNGKVLKNQLREENAID